MNHYEFKNITPLSWNDRVRFECSRCCKCCRHVKNSVPLESLDVFRLAQFLTAKGILSYPSIDEVLTRYAEMFFIDECGYFTYCLKTTGSDDACIFLKENRCYIHTVKPRACRTYPFLAEPTSFGRFNYHLSIEQPHHFHGHSHKVRNWMKQYFTREDQEFVTLDFQTAPLIADLLRKIPPEKKETALFCFLTYKYLRFRLDQPFLEQFKQNQQRLITLLTNLSKNE